MRPALAAALVRRVLSSPTALVGAGVVGALVAAPSAASPEVLALAATPEGLPAWLVPLLPWLAGAVTGTGAAALLWIARAVAGVSGAALAAALEAGATQIERNAARTKDPSDDVQATAWSAAMRAAAAQIRLVVDTIPNNARKRESE